MTELLRPAWVEVDLAAIRHNARVLAALATPSALCAVVKADGYGHGAIDVARSALVGGAQALAVALVEEGLVLRAAGIEAPILLLSEPTDAGMDEAVQANLTPTLYRLDGVDAARRSARRHQATVPVHVKVDTGMHRVGCNPNDLLEVVTAVSRASELTLQGVWTHLAVADDPADPFTGTQLDRFATSLKELADAGIEVPLRHAANSAGAIAFPAARFDWVRCGIALYGHLPAPTVGAYLGSSLAGINELRPALSLKARVHMVRPLDAGERTSYGRTYQLETAANIAVVPLGYHDGIPRALATAGASVLIGGKRRRIAGTVTMDQIMVDCGDDTVNPGDEVVLIGRQGDEEIPAEEWAGLLSTIVYEVLCGIGPRVPRVSADSEA